VKRNKVYWHRLDPRHSILSAVKKPILLLLAIVVGFGGLLAPARATVDDALSFALEGMDKYIKQGYTLREDTWGGDLPVGEAKAITHQLFKGNDYWFCMGTDTKGATISIHLYDSDGNLVESDSWQNAKTDGAFAGAEIHCKRTGTYFLIVKIEKSPEERTAWGLVYSYK
jgi:hypothetical protein